MTTRDEVDAVEEHRDRFMEAYREANQHFPLILHEECYEFFGDWVKIVGANVFSHAGDAEVDVENRRGDRQTVQMSDLDWKYGRRLDPRSN